MVLAEEDARQLGGPVGLFDGTQILTNKVRITGNREADNIAYLAVRDLGSAEWTTVREAPPGFLIDDEFWDNGRLVTREHREFYEYGPFTYRVVVTESDGSAYRLDHADQIDDPTIPFLALDGDVVAWAETDRDVSSCLYVRDLAADVAVRTYCVDPPRQIGWVALSGTVVTWTEQRPAPDDRWCRSLWTLTLPDGAPQQLPATECEAFAGVATLDRAIWVEAPYDSDHFGWSDAIGYDRASGTTTALGLAGAGSVHACGGGIYYNTITLPAPNDFEIRTWSPGGPVRVIARASEPYDLITSTNCADGHVTLYQSRTDGGMKARLVELLVDE